MKKNFYHGFWYSRTLYYLFVIFVIVFSVFYIFYPQERPYSQDVFPPNTNLTQSKDLNFAYENLTNTFQTKFKNSALEEYSVWFQNSIGGITFYTPKNQVFGSLENSIPESSGSYLTYKNIFPGVDLKYTVSSTRLLEEFIVHNKEAARNLTKITQLAKTKNSFRKNEDGSITFFDNDSKETAFIIPRPVIYEVENKSVLTNSISYEIFQDRDNSGIVISKVISEEGKNWMLDSQRKYPIAIDLVIDNADVYTDWVSSDPTNTNVQDEQLIKYEGASSLKVSTLAYQAPLSIDLMEYASDANAQSNYVSNGVYSATGGTITTSGNDKIHTFTSNGTFTPSQAMNTQVLMVGGGGGGSTSPYDGNYSLSAGGGGGGGVVYSASRALSATGYPIVIGIGGTGAISNITSITPPTNGGNTTFSGLTALGGGRGGYYSVYPAGNGGSGGGGGAYNFAGGSGTQGNNGGTGGSGSITYRSGGGGGGGGAGVAGDSGGTGGIGYLSNISGANTRYAGGGGGGCWNCSAGLGGAGGGGNGGSSGGGGASGAANTGGGGGGGSYSGGGGAGGSGIAIIRYTTYDLQSFYETNLKSQGSYSLKAIAQATLSLNKTLTKTITSPLNLSNYTNIGFDLRASRVGSNLKVGFRDSGGVTTEIVPNVTQADTFQSFNLDISNVSLANKDAINQIVITITNADAINTFYLDNIVATSPTSTGDTITKTTPSSDLSSSAFITFRIYSTAPGAFLNFGFGESSSTEQVQSITINSANTWETKVIDLQTIPSISRDSVTKFSFIVAGDSQGATFYIDDLQSNQLFTPTIRSGQALSSSSIRWNFTDNALDETGYSVYDTLNNLSITCLGGGLSYCDESGLSANTQYTRKVAAYKTDIGRGFFSGSDTKYTLANRPDPIVVNRSDTSAQFTLSTSSNPANTMYAVYKDLDSNCDGVGGSYLNINGTDNASTPIWAQLSSWGSGGTVSVSNLSQEQAYYFCVKARNGDLVETQFSPSSTSNTGEIVPVSGNLIINTSGTTSFINRYRDGSDPERYIIGFDNVGPSQQNSSELTLENGSITINSNETLVVGKLNLVDGSLFLAINGGRIAPGSKLWTIDRDQDGYPDKLGGEIKVWYSTDTPQSTISASYFRRKSLLTTLVTADCNDNSYSTTNICCQDYIYYLDSDGDTYGTGAGVTFCQSTPQLPAGYSNNNSDCNDGSNQVWYSHGQCYADLDGDTYTNGLANNTTCLNSASCTTATKASASTNGAAVTTYVSGRLRDVASGTVDCYDSNANAKPGSTTCSTTHRGDGSFDFNCSSTQTPCNGTYYASTSYYQDYAVTNCTCRYFAATLNAYNFSGTATCGSTGYTRTSPIVRIGACDSDAGVCNNKTVYQSYGTATQACQ